MEANQENISIHSDLEVQLNFWIEELRNVVGEMTTPFVCSACGREGNSRQMGSQSYQVVAKGKCPSRCCVWTPPFVAQAEVVTSAAPTQSHDGVENVHFTTAPDEHVAQVFSGTDITVDQSHYDDADLGAFFSRPVRIASGTWGVGSPFSLSVYPWQAFFYDNVAVREKIKYFNLLRCQMHVRVVVNGTPFHVGKALAAWDPMNAAIPSTVIGGTRQHITRSQLPRLFIDPGTNSGGCLCLPFFYNNPWFSIPFDVFQDMGNLTIQSFADLAMCNGGTQSVTITVFAWATDVKVCVPTTAYTGEAEVVKKPGKHKKKAKKRPGNAVSLTQRDEFHDNGAISSVASAVASAATALEDVPVIGLFARATSIGASAVGNIAKLFGFSRPVTLEPIKFFKAAPMGQMAQTVGSEAVLKLTLDPKQEITVDPTTVGLNGVDELAISYIAGKESYFGQFTWDVSDAADTVLAVWNVHPLVASATGISSVTSPAGDKITPTAVHYLSRVFNHWSGSLIFRIQAISSPMQKGRLALFYDPYKNPEAESDYFNKTYCQILDLEASRDFEVQIAWCQYRGYAVVRTVENTPTFVASSSTGLTKGDYDNGVVVISVLNDLVSPDETTGITFNVFVRAGPDFELMNPNGRQAIMSPFDGQAEVISGGEHRETDNSPGYVPQVPLMESTTQEAVDAKPLVYFGEKIVSIRSLLKRYTRYMSWNYGGGSSSANDWTIYRSIFRSFPVFYGYDPNGLYLLSDDSTPFNYTVNPYIAYFFMCYAGWRGSVRYKILSVATSNNKGEMYALRQPTFTGADVSFGSAVNIAAGANANEVGFRWGYDGLYSGAGMGSTEKSTMPCLEVEVPFQSQYRFIQAKKFYADNIDASACPDDLTAQTWALYNDVYGNNQGRVINTMYCAGGDDFTFFFWVGAPTFYVWDTPFPNPSTS